MKKLTDSFLKKVAIFTAIKGGLFASLALALYLGGISKAPVFLIFLLISVVLFLISSICWGILSERNLKRMIAKN